MISSLLTELGHGRMENVRPSIILYKCCCAIGLEKSAILSSMTSTCRFSCQASNFSQVTKGKQNFRAACAKRTLEFLFNSFMRACTMNEL